MIRRRASPLRPALPRLLPRSPRSSAVWRECPRAWSCCRGSGWPNSFPDEEWEALGPDERRARIEATHPQFHLKLLLDRLGVARGEVQPWRWSGGAASSPARGRASPTRWPSPEFSHKWEQSEARRAPPDGHSTRRASRSGGGSAGDRAGIAGSARDAGAERPRWSRPTGSSPAAFPPCWRGGASRPTTAPASRCRRRRRAHCCWHCQRRGGGAGARARCWRLLKHPLVGGEGEERLAWLDAVRDARPQAARPAPACGLAGLDAHFADDARLAEGCAAEVEAARRSVLSDPISLCGVRASALSEAAQALAGDAAWRGPPGEWRPRCLPNCRRHRLRIGLTVGGADAVPLLRQLLEARARPAALRRASAHLHLGLARSAASACRSGGARRPQRGRVAGAPRARSLAAAEGARGAWNADAREPDRACRRTISPARSARLKC